MKKRLLSVLLILSLVLTYLPQIVFAMNNEITLDISVGSIVFTDDGAEQNGVNQTADVYRITGTTTSNTLTVNTSGTTNLVFDNLIITRSNESKMVEINSGYAKVMIVGTNEIGCTNANRYASIYVAVDATIEFTSDSTGSLNVYNSTNSTNSGNSAAAIGASHKGKGLNGGTIIINGGNITAKAGYGSAGIGGGNGTNIQAIIINGGTVTSTSTSRGTGIGSGKGASVDSLIITGGVIITKPNGADAIGAGQYGTVTTKNISGGIISEDNGTNFIVYGGTMLTNSFELPSSSKLTVPSDCSLTVADGVMLTNNGTIIIEDGGKLVNYGTIINNGTITNNGTLANGGTLTGTGALSGNSVKLPAKYLDENGEEQTAYCDAAITQDNIGSYETLDTGWYVVNSDVTISNRITVSGSVNLILANECHLSAEDGIHIGAGNSLTTYAQSTGSNMGTLIAKNNVSGSNYAAIGSNSDENAGAITINGGNVQAFSYGDPYSGNGGAAAIGGGKCGSGGTITINGGMVSAQNDANNYTGVIGAGILGSTGAVTINGGTVNAIAQNAYCCGIGGSGGSVTINGGTVNVVGSWGIPGIGSAGHPSNQGVSVTICGGIVYTNGIGKGLNSADGTFSTTSSGNAVIYTDYIHDQSQKESWKGIIFEGDDGVVYGDQTLCGVFTIPTGKNLTIPADTTLNAGNYLTNNGQVFVEGTLVGAVDSVYYPLTVSGGAADGDVSTYQDKVYGKATGTVTLTGTNIPVGQAVGSWTTSDSTMTITDNTFTMPSEALTITVQYINTPTYTVTIPATVELGEDITISAEDVNVVDGSQLEIKLTDTSDDADGFILENSYGETVEYEIINSTTNGAVALNDEVLTVAGGVANNSETQAFKLNRVTQKVKHSDIYKGTVTFTISIKEVTIS